MEWLIVAVMAAAGGTLGRRTWRGRRRRRELALEQAQELETARRLADEDVTVLGEQLQRLDAEVPDPRSTRRRGWTTRPRSTPTSPRSARCRRCAAPRR